MKILLLGATGRTGKWILEEAIGRGHSVHALVRNPAKVKFSNGRLTLFEGTPADSAALEKAMQGCDAIISAINISRANDFPWSPLRTPKDFLSASMKNIIALAQRHFINRIIITSAWGVAETKSDIPGWFRWFIEHSNIRYPYNDHAVQEALLKASTLDWTCVRPVGLTNSKKDKTITVTLDKTPKPTLLIPRRMVAKFMMDALEKNLYVKQLPVISAK
ncbi:MAG TPA: NAD(P)H-binding protein [Chitinophagaceae bacterium]|jgi:putative NADH-flavin reductase|nr:NAD(P)H-binding protein [Chitinophagaceae bacterium]